MAKCYIYRNLHKNCWSVRHKGRVILHAPSVFVWDPEFKVSKNGNAKVREEQRKNVHAYVVADPEDVWVSEGSNVKICRSLKVVPEIRKASIINNLGRPNNTRVTYRPYEMESFEEVESGEPVFSSETAWLTNGGDVYRDDACPPL